MINALSKECKIVPIEDSVAAGKATTVGEIVDIKGFNSACFIYKLGAVTDGAAITLKVYESAAANMANAAELAGASAAIAVTASDSEKMLVVDILRPRKRYLRPTIVTATQNVEIDSAFAILYNPATKPVVQPTAVGVNTLVVSPAPV